MTGIDLTHHDSAASVDRRAWDSLCGHTGFSRSGWLRAVESFAAAPARPHLLTAGFEGAICGGMILRFDNDPHAADGITRRLLGGNRRLRSLWRQVGGPALVAGAPHGYGGELLLREDLDDGHRRRVADLLFDGAENLSRELRASLWFSGVREADTTLINSLGTRGYPHGRYLPLAEVDIEWESFEEYLQWQRRRSPRLARKIRRERERCREAGVTLVEPEDLSGFGPVFHDLCSRTLTKYGESDFPFRPEFFDAVRSELGAAYLVCAAMRHGQIIGFSSLIRDGDTAWADSYGLDYGKADGTFTYFDLTHYWPIEKAIELGLKRVVFGRGQYDAKLRRGCRLSDTYIYCGWPYRLGRSLSGVLLATVDRHYAKQVLTA